MTGKQVREKQTSQLPAELLEQQRHLYDLRSQAVTEKLEDPSQLRKTKKDIARIKTIMRQRELEEAKKTEKPEQKKTAKSKAAKATKPARATTRKPRQQTAKA
jgi:large subunit ribosomal protein L29